MIEIELIAFFLVNSTGSRKHAAEMDIINKKGK
jgi:hypothetical protein